ASAQALPTLVRSFRDPDPRVRARAARVVGRLGTREASRAAAAGYIEDLRRLTSDPDSDVRKAASAALVEILAEERVVAVTERRFPRGEITSQFTPVMSSRRGPAVGGARARAAADSPGPPRGATGCGCAGPT